MRGSALIIDALLLLAAAVAGWIIGTALYVLLSMVVG